MRALAIALIAVAAMAAIFGADMWLPKDDVENWSQAGTFIIVWACAMLTFMGDNE